MNFNSIKKIFASALKFKGFIPLSGSKLFICDRNFYLIFAELQDCHSIGFFFSIGIKFLWSDCTTLSYDYTEGSDSRVYIPKNYNSPFGAMLYDSETLDDDIDLILKETDRRIAIYNELSDILILENKLKTRHDFVAIASPDIKSRDVNHAITLALLNHSDEALVIFENMAGVNKIAHELINVYNDEFELRKRLIELINQSRNVLAKRYKISLENINTL